MFDAERRRWLLPLIIGLLVLFFDQLSKRWILENLGPVPMQREIAILGDWFNIVYSRNTGVAFGFFQHMSPLLTVVSLLITVGAIYVYIVYLPNYRLSVQLSVGLILGGAIGNIVDRLRLGYVVDMVQVGWWPVFNLADSAISVGAVVLAVYLLLASDEDMEQPDPHDEALLNELLQRDAGTLEREQ